MSALFKILNSFAINNIISLEIYRGCGGVEVALELQKGFDQLARSQFTLSIKDPVLVLLKGEQSFEVCRSRSRQQSELHKRIVLFYVVRAIRTPSAYSLHKQLS